MSVVAAFLLSGLANAGTPFDTASTPESATAPEENARRSMKRPSTEVWCFSSTASLLSIDSGIGPTCWMKMRYSPTAMRTTSIRM
ncbi:unannotated protein [freshwater metagenome]|uniref:Unannotated protein n=1 Tax=freshwater metagenome TaxID=449393 RepID=A0A6J6ZCC5_9ZZZZ